MSRSCAHGNRPGSRLQRWCARCWTCPASHRSSPSRSLSRSRTPSRSRTVGFIGSRYPNQSLQLWTKAIWSALTSRAARRVPSPRGAAIGKRSRRRARGAAVTGAVAVAGAGAGAHSTEGDTAARTSITTTATIPAAMMITVAMITVAMSIAVATAKRQPGTAGCRVSAAARSTRTTAASRSRSPSQSTSTSTITTAARAAARPGDTHLPGNSPAKPLRAVSTRSGPRACQCMLPLQAGNHSEPRACPCILRSRLSVLPVMQQPSSRSTGMRAQMMRSQRLPVEWAGSRRLARSRTTLTRRTPRRRLCRGLWTSLHRPHRHRIPRARHRRRAPLPYRRPRRLRPRRSSLLRPSGRWPRPRRRRSSTTWVLLTLTIRTGV